jgi:biopolymer transport protein TolQ
MTWAIILHKLKTLKLAQEQNAKFLEFFWNAKALDEVSAALVDYSASPIARVFQAGYRELRKLPDLENVSRALQRSHSVEIDALERYIDWLASTASAAPFVGLFGTVWGIMNSFQNIGAMGSASLAVVAPGISEALIATAMGLAAAIPAAIFYNFLVGKTKRQSLDMETFTQDFLNLVQRGLSRKPENGNETVNP